MTKETEMQTEIEKQNAKDANRDPITGAPGSHPVGTGVGTVGGAVSGAVIGSLAGPIGAAVGLVAGGIAGGLAGKGVAETMDPTIEDAYWETNYSQRDYVRDNAPYDIYQPAYRAGYEGFARYGETFDEAEADLQRDYENMRSDSTLSWEEARFAARDAWNRRETAELA